MVPPGLISLPFWALAATGLLLAVNISSLAEDTAVAAGRVAARSRLLKADEWDRSPAAMRWYGAGMAAAALYGCGVLLGWRALAAGALALGLVAFAASLLRRPRASRDKAGWSDRLRLWQLAGWSGPFLVGLVAVVLAGVLGIR